MAKSRCKLSSQVEFASKSFSRSSCFKLNKSLYIAKSRQWHNTALNNFLLHLRNHAFEDLYMLNNGISKRINKQTLRVIVWSRCWEILLISSLQYCYNCQRNYTLFYKLKLWKNKEAKIGKIKSEQITN